MDIREKLALPQAKKPLILTMGNFDGVHLGHQHLLQRVVSLAGDLQTSSGVITFRNTPSEVLRPEKSTKALCSLSQKIELLEKFGIDTLFLLEFTKGLSEQSPEEFLKNLMDHVPFSHLILGYDARFGKNCEGDTEKVLTVSKELGFEVEYLPAFKLKERVVSSSAIRKEIQAGRLDEAEKMLGRPYSIHSLVTEGTGTGKRIGFPTANVQVSSFCLPPMGVWVVTVNLQGVIHEGIANLGVAPTVRDDTHPILEVHLFDHESVLYDQEIEVTFKKYLRNEKRFSSIEELKRQIQSDVGEAKAFFQNKISK